MSDETKGQDSFERTDQISTEWAKGWHFPDDEGLQYTEGTVPDVPSTEDLTAAISEHLTEEEVSAMLQNVEDEQQPDFATPVLPDNPNYAPATPAEVTRKEFESFKTRVIAAFKNAGFKL